jgi:transcription elongation factor
MVAEDKRTEVLAMDPAPRPQDQGWVRLRGNTKKLRRYKGDLALVVGLTGSNLLDLWLVPRLDFGLGQDDMIPAAQLFNADGLRASFGADSLWKKTGKETFIFQKNTFSSQGYLVLSRREMHICEEFEAIPTEKELDSFLGCNELLPETLAKTRSRMESAKVMLDDRVKVLSGTFRGLLGKVVGMTADEADVHLPSQDLVERLRIWELAREFRVGDRVRTRIGNSESGAEMVRLGWVTKVSGSHVSVFDSVDSSEVSRHSIFNFPVTEDL